MDTLGYGFKIICLDCGKVLELKEYNNNILRTESITVAPNNNIGIVEIECECGNQINCNYKSMTIAEHMMNILIERGYESVSFCDLDEIEECAKRSGMYNRVKDSKGNHPLNISNKVLTLDRSDLLDKRYMKGNKNRDIRCFYLKNNN